MFQFRFKIQFPLLLIYKVQLEQKQKDCFLRVPQLDQGRVVSTSPPSQSWVQESEGDRHRHPLPPVQGCVSATGLPAWGPFCWAPAGNIVLFLGITLQTRIQRFLWFSVTIPCPFSLRVTTYTSWFWRFVKHILPRYPQRSPVTCKPWYLNSLKYLPEIGRLLVPFWKGPF